jgi:hypothetical protein
MKYIWWLVIGAGILAIVYTLMNWGKPASSAPLNASGYTYPSTSGA